MVTSYAEQMVDTENMINQSNRMLNLRSFVFKMVCLDGGWSGDAMHLDC